MARAIFELSITPFPGELTVVSFRGREQISKPYSFEVLVLTDDDLLSLPLLGMPARFTMEVPDRGRRIVQGVVASIEPEGSSSPSERHPYRIRVVPRLWLLKKRVTSRIFQHLTVPEIVSAVLDGAGVAASWRLYRDHPAREYCVQYQESDYTFVKRLLAEEGIFYYFEPPSGLADKLTGGLASEVGGAAAAVGGAIGGAAGGAIASVSGALGISETVVFSDTAKLYPPLPDGAGLDLGVSASVALDLGASGVSASAGVSLGAGGPSPRLRLHDARGVKGTDQDVFRFTLRHAVRTNAVLLRDYDFRRPMLDLRAEAGALPGGVSASASIDASVSLSSAPSIDVSASAAVSVGPELRAYEHRGEYDLPEVDPARAEITLEQYKHGAVVGEGSSWCRRLTAGHRFRLEADAAGHIAGEYVVTRVEHEGRTPEFSEGAPSAGDPRAYENRFACAPASVPVRPKRPKRRLRQVLESATVVGPSGEEIHTDEYGRIRVQFHWDLEGVRNEHSSCWIRVVQAWGGATWGFQFIPRVGMEVMVTFLGGDQDVPVITGCVYNAAMPVPFKLPEDKSRSGIRTRSTPRSEGFNEISFEDALGDEQIYVRAERDLDEDILHDRSQTVGGERRANVSGDDSLQINGDSRFLVDGSRTARIGGELSTTVGGDVSETLRKSRTTFVEGDDSLMVIGGSTQTVIGPRVVDVDGEHVLTIGSGSDTGVGQVNVSGTYTIGASKTITLVGQEGIKIICGDSALAITPEGIELAAKQITIKGSQGVTAEGPGPALNLGDEAELVAKVVKIYSSDAAIELEKDAAIWGKKVLLNCSKNPPPEKEGDEKEAPKRPLKLRFTDVDFNPYADKKYQMFVDGRRYEGTTNGNGQIVEDVPETAQLVQVTMWIDEYPEGRKKRWAFRAAEDLGDAASVRGAKVRLKNLGYFRGEVDDDEDGDYFAALRWFQEDHELEVTGELDGATSGELTKVYGQ